MRIYFGRKPENDEIFNLDVKIMECLIDEDYNFNNAVDSLVEHIMNIWDGWNGVCHTVNPLIISYFTDDFAKEYVWLIDEEGNHINMGKDEHMMSKLGCLTPGEVVCDDWRSFK